MESVHQIIQGEHLHQRLTLEQQEEAGFEGSRGTGPPSEELLAHQQQLRANLRQQQEQERQEQEARRQRAKEEAQQIAEAEAKAFAEAELKAFFVKDKGEGGLGEALKDAEIIITTGKAKKRRNEAATRVQTKERQRQASARVGAIREDIANRRDYGAATTVQTQVRGRQATQRVEALKQKRQDDAATMLQVSELGTPERALSASVPNTCTPLHKAQTHPPTSTCTRAQCRQGRASARPRFALMA